MNSAGFPLLALQKPDHLLQHVHGTQQGTPNRRRRKYAVLHVLHTALQNLFHVVRQPPDAAQSQDVATALECVCGAHGLLHHPGRAVSRNPGGNRCFNFQNLPRRIKQEYL